MTIPCNITTRHCESCGSTDREDIGLGGGYSSCCNQLIADRPTCRNHHGEEAAFQAALDAAMVEAGYGNRNAWLTADPVGFNAAAARAEAAL